MYYTRSAFNIISIIVWFLFVETKGRSLEEIDAVFGDVSHAEVMQAADEKVANTSFEDRSNIKKDESDSV